MGENIKLLKNKYFRPLVRFFNGDSSDTCIYSIGVRIIFLFIKLFLFCRGRNHFFIHKIVCLIGEEWGIGYM